MTNATADAGTDDKPEHAPIDLATMRASTALLIGPDDAPEALPPTGDELDTLTLRIRGQMELILPEVEVLAEKAPRKSVVQYCAFACIGEARRKLTATAAANRGGAVAYARRLARSLNALCDHYENLQPGVSA
ncbi:DUF6415 family natural product biosynthesis protein [Streptomyces sp. NBC_01239]|uniref:DUF6415 family natural product biosynthesis protein n=1 Tax=Streptomyces sp. NBC_01239 TaxID=2903792 RepID=UPI00224E7962|nr:DUF6415 family natural product biosynthesis protein [Streptomyces sp. NBC_01239]MCX4813674.1 DUF6415 family natural product biosynthesis protein [Streptomyces sp. NBC_01239]